MGTVPIANASPESAQVFSASTSRAPEIVQPALTDPGTPEWIHRVEKRIDELALLGENWDGRYSDPVSCDALYFAWSVLVSIMKLQTPAPAMVPLSHGGVQLIWSSAAGEIEVEIVRPNDAVVYWRDRTTGKEYEEPATTDFGELARILEAFA